MTALRLKRAALRGRLKKRFFEPVQTFVWYRRYLHLRPKGFKDGAREKRSTHPGLEYELVHRLLKNVVFGLARRE